MCVCVCGWARPVYILRRLHLSIFLCYLPGADNIFSRHGQMCAVQLKSQESWSRQRGVVEEAEKLNHKSHRVHLWRTAAHFKAGRAGF